MAECGGREKDSEGLSEGVSCALTLRQLYRSLLANRAHDGVAAAAEEETLFTTESVVDNAGDQEQKQPAAEAAIFRSFSVLHMQQHLPLTNRMASVEPRDSLRLATCRKLREGYTNGNRRNPTSISHTHTHTRTEKKRKSKSGIRKLEAKLSIRERTARTRGVCNRGESRWLAIVIINSWRTRNWASTDAHLARCIRFFFHLVFLPLFLILVRYPAVPRYRHVLSRSHRPLYKPWHCILLHVRSIRRSTTTTTRAPSLCLVLQRVCARLFPKIRQQRPSSVNSTLHSYANARKARKRNHLNRALAAKFYQYQ